MRSHTHTQSRERKHTTKYDIENEKKEKRWADYSVKKTKKKGDRFVRRNLKYARFDKIQIKIRKKKKKTNQMF